MKKKVLEPGEFVCNVAVTESIQITPLIVIPQKVAPAKVSKLLAKYVSDKDGLKNDYKQ